VSHFKTYIGIDYSGSGTPLTRTAGLQVYAAATNRLPKRVEPPGADKKRHRNWNRKEIAEWLIRQAESGGPFIAGLDFSFSLPISYFRRYGLADWDAFLRDFVQHWPTDQGDATVDAFRPGNCRTGSNDELRLTERWTSSAKSNFQFDVQGQVAKSTHAGIPWLYRIRQQVGKQVHFGLFDGWKVPKRRSVIAEVFPSILRRRFPREDRTADQHDSYAISRWLKEMDVGMTLDEVYFDPPLNQDEQEIAELEGWILGVM